MLALSDATGLILHLFASSQSEGEEIRRTNLFKGASWHERDIGSNGVGTALATGEPVILIGPEHFQEAYLGWTCIGVPLADRPGQVIGVLDLSVQTDGHESMNFPSISGARGDGNCFWRGTRTAHRETSRYLPFFQQWRGKRATMTPCVCRGRVLWAWSRMHFGPPSNVS